MPTIIFPDGNTRTYEHPISVVQVAKGVSNGLAKAAIAAKVGDNLVDTSYIIDEDVELSIITNECSEALEVIRHSTAHLLAMAVQNLYPKTQVTIGPVIENGFYYDFSSEVNFSDEDLTKIEKRMRYFSEQNLPIERVVMDKQQAIDEFEKMGEHYKVEIIKDLAEGEPISIYRQGCWKDLCRGPHVPSTKFLKHFKLMKVSGAYWRGDASNDMLQRIYGTAWLTKDDLNGYLYQLEEAQKRDHRKLGKKMNLFHFQDEAPGMVFWHSKGWQLYSTIKEHLRSVQMTNGYQEINTPMIVDKVLWQRSGHWDKYSENMFVVESESKDYAIKPMNCPCHVQVYKQNIHSYRDLPVRLAEFGSCHRNELSGTLQGLMRVRAFVQDDGHIFCSEEQIQIEVANFIDLVYQVYADFGFHEVLVKLSTRPPKRVGSDAIWDKSEQALAEALDSKKIMWEYLPGEGAFYGPKVEFSLKDCLGRIWQCGTVQVDFSMPERLNAYYIDADNERKSPVMLHRAIVGSFERFIGILLEETEGFLPTWLAPIQVVIMNITDEHRQYCEKINKDLSNIGFRVALDLRNEKIGFKIRTHSIQRVPWLLIIGQEEVDSYTLSIRSKDGEMKKNISINEFAELLQRDIDSKGNH